MISLHSNRQKIIIGGLIAVIVCLSFVVISLLLRDQKILDASMGANNFIVPSDLQNQTDWTREFVRLYPSIHLCLKSHSAQPARIDGVALRPDQSVLMVVVGQDASSFLCVLDKIGAKKTDNFAPVDVGTLPAELVSPLRSTYTPAEFGLPLPDSCHSHLQIKDRTGKIFGFLTLKKC
jgi:hypothetical protein